MDILGIGMPELFFIVLIALIVLGPKDMQKAGKTVGSFFRKVVMSPEWRTVKDVSRKVSALPNQLMREANEDLQSYTNDIKAEIPDLKNSIGTWAGNSSSSRPEFKKSTVAEKPSNSPEKTEIDNTIAPASSQPSADSEGENA